MFKKCLVKWLEFFGFRASPLHFTAPSANICSNFLKSPLSPEKESSSKCSSLSLATAQYCVSSSSPPPSAVAQWAKVAFCKGILVRNLLSAKIMAALFKNSFHVLLKQVNWGTRYLKESITLFVTSVDRCLVGNYMVISSFPLFWPFRYSVSRGSTMPCSSADTQQSGRLLGLYELRFLTNCSATWYVRRIGSRLPQWSALYPEQSMTTIDLILSRLIHLFYVFSGSQK